MQCVVVCVYAHDCIRDGAGNVKGTQDRRIRHWVAGAWVIARAHEGRASAGMICGTRQ